jgi:hypothetical protein
VTRATDDDDDDDDDAPTHRVPGGAAKDVDTATTTPVMRARETTVAIVVRLAKRARAGQIIKRVGHAPIAKVQKR